MKAHSPEENMKKHSRPSDNLDHPAGIAREWEQAIDATNDAIWIIDHEQRIVRCNQTSEALFGRPAAEMIGEHCWKIVHRTACPIPECPFTRAKVSCRRESVELQVDDRWFEITVDPILDESGDFNRAVHIIRDISERRQLQRALLESNERLRSITEASSEGIWQVDLNGRFIYVSKAIENIFGYTPEEALELGFAAFFVDSDLETAKGAFQKAVAGLEYQLLELNGRTKKGQPIPIEVSAMPYRRGGKIVGVQGFARDIAERRLVEDELRKNQSFNETLLNTTPDIIYIYDLVERKNIYSNQSVGTVLGYSVEEIQAMGDAMIPSLMHPDDLKSYLSVILPRYQAAQDGELIEHEYRMKHRGGAWRWLVSKESIHNRLPDGSPRQIIGIIGDISNRKRAEQALRESEARLRTAGQASYDLIYEWDPMSDSLEWFGDIDTMLGFESGDISRDISAWLALILPEDRGQLKNATEIHRTSIVPINYDYRIQRKDGTIRFWNDHALPILNGQGQPTKWVGVCTDITERKAAEKALRESQRQLATLMNNLPGMAYRCNDDRDWTMQFVSEGCRALTGYEPQHIIGNARISYASIIHPEDRAAVWSRVHQSLNARTLFQISYRITAQDGIEKRVWEQGQGIYGDKGQLLAIEGFITDVSDRERAEHALRESEERFRSITEQMSDMIYLTDTEGTITYVSPASVSIFGCSPEEIEGLNFKAFLPSESIPPAMDAFNDSVHRGDPAASVELQMKRMNGETFVGELTGRRYKKNSESGTIGVIRDITDRKRAEEEKLSIEAQLRQSQKLESIGTLASGVAHEVNNPLMGMINYAELIKDRVEGDKRTREYTEAIITEGNRIATIVRNLLAFARQDDTEQGSAHIHDIIAAALSLLHASLRKFQIQVELQVPDDLPQLTCRSQQIQQVIVNLLTNAQGALNIRYPEYDANKILSISAGIHEDEKQWLRITVEDHGSGIAEEFQDRIFDPFFTSKTRDQGTGLGLSVSHGIIKEHRGRLTFETKPGEFTRFHVDLPLHDAESA
jgi:PAS domain S-box-containing protein